MLKYLVKRGNIYWYRRLVKECGEIVFSLRTNNYNLALKRYSFIDHQISYLIFTGAFKVKKKKKKKKKILLSDMFEKYIQEKESVKPLGDKNKRDLEYVFKNLISWFENCPAEKLKREGFLNFRTNCVMYLPQKPNKKIFKDKTTKEIIQIVQKKSLDTLGTGTTNKHMRRVHQVYNWAYEIARLIKLIQQKTFKYKMKLPLKKVRRK